MVASDHRRVVPTLPEARPASRRRLPFRRWVRELGWRHAVAWIAVAFSLWPVIWVVSASINAVDNLTAARLIPQRTTLDNFRSLFAGDPLTPFMRWLWNTWKVAVTASILNVFVASLAAYAFSRFRFRGRRVGLLTLLLVQVFPQFLAFIAIFLLLLQIGTVFPAVGLGTHAGLILVYLGGAIGFNAFLIKGFMDSLPMSLDESARIDGASPWQVFWHIVLPLARPVLAVIFIITFIGLYSEFILAQTLLRQVNDFTFAVGLRLFVQTEYAARWGMLAAAAVVGSLPIVITFLVAQRHIVSGLTQGAVKE